MMIFFVSACLSLVYSKLECKCKHVFEPLNDAPVYSTLTDAETLSKITSKTLGQYAIVEIIGRKDPSARGFLHIIKVLSENNANTLIETGASHPDVENCLPNSCSTLILAKFAHLTNRKVISLIQNTTYIENALKQTEMFSKNIQILANNPIKYLENFQGLIDLVFISGNDQNDLSIEDKQNYYYEQIQAAYYHLHKKSVVALDNCESQKPCFCEKAKEYLIYNNWVLVVTGKVQVFTYSGL
ncbi:hypothetical protein SteCoe_10223 [Stentor coeruleus]|uniref:Uncharacterized protein n=1 Tax=Stentor coeruleus TaxID=5963 RepID=A0A1R2CGA9_9CILI|nr:hypothetical protein SteCoe_10223 [Stentor coeruleus]